MQKVGHRNFKGRYKQGLHGFTLLEFLIAGLIGLVLLTATIELLLITTRMGRVQDALAEINENAYFIMDFMRQEIEMAGSTGDLFAPPLVPFDWTRTEDVGSPFDTFTIRRQYAANDYDCLGEKVPPERQGVTVLSRYFVAKMPGEQPLFELRCEVWLEPKGEAPQRLKSTALIAGVESMQVQYGVTPLLGGASRSTRIPVAYLTANNVDPVHHNVVSIRIALLLYNSNGKPLGRSRETAPAIDLLEKHFAHGGAEIDLNDGHLRRSYQMTVVLKNVI